MGRIILRLGVAAGWVLVVFYWVHTADVEGWSWRRIFHRWTFPEVERGLLLTLPVLAATPLAWSRRPRETAVRIAMVGASVGLSLALLELPAALGIFDWNRVLGLPDAVRFTRLRPWENPSNVADPELVFRRRPDHAFSGEVAGDLVFHYGIATDRRYRVDVRYDAHGFRNDPTPERAEVALVGDSFVEAGLVPAPRTLAGQLAERLDARVANLGQSGYGPLQERIVLERYALPLRPELVVWLFFEGNDLLDDARFLRQRRRQHDPAPSSFRERSLMAQILPRIALATEGLRHEDSPKARSRRGLCHGERVYFAYRGEPLPPAQREALPGALETIDDARRTARAHGAELLLVFTPIKYRVYRPFCRFGPEAEPADWTLNDLPDHMAQWACAQGVPFLDLTPALRAAAGRGEPVFFADDGHWSGEGQGVAAEAIAAHAARGLPACEAPGAAATPAASPRTDAARP